MLYIFWTLLNINLALFALYLVVGLIRKGKSFLTPRLRGIGMFILALGILQVLADDDAEEFPNRIKCGWEYDEAAVLHSEGFELDDNPVFTTKVLVEYAQHENRITPVSTTGDLFGLIAGFEWKLNHAIFHENHAANGLRGKIDGTLIWSLCGIPVYHQSTNHTVVLEVPKD